VAQPQIGLGAGDHVADGDRFPGFRVRDQAVVGVLVMQVIDGGDRLGPAAQGRMVKRIGHPVAADPQLAVVAQAAQEIGSGTGGHGSILRLLFPAG